MPGEGTTVVAGVGSGLSTIDGNKGDGSGSVERESVVEMGTAGAVVATASPNSG